MDEGVFILDQRDVHLDTPASRHKRRRKYVESNVIAKNWSKIIGDNLEIITLCGGLDDGVVKTTNNAIRERL